MRSIITSCLIICIILLSCSGSLKQTKHSITKFDKPIIDTIIPEKGVGYTTKFIKLRGTTNDTIFVSLGHDGIKNYFSGNIDTVITGDYYGYHKAVFIFNPYKATSGNLEVEFNLQ